MQFCTERWIFMTIGDRIKKIREIFDITSNDFAKLVGIHPVTIRKYETNKMKPSKEHIDKMCEALKLPRMIFEGIPEQYTNYDLRGDFYQQLFMMLATNTLSATDKSYSFSINSKLNRFIEIKHGDKVLPLEDLRIEYKSNEEFPHDNSIVWFAQYINILQKIEKINATKNWSTEKNGETKQECTLRLTNIALEIQLKLMLEEHSWRQYMAGPGTFDNQKILLNEIFANGGSFYDYVAQIDAPETYKDRLIDEYEELRILEECNYPQNPPHGFNDEMLEEYLRGKEKIVAKYKKEHPNWHMNMNKK